MGPRSGVHEVQVNFDLPKDVFDALADFCEKRNVKKKAIMELALRRFLASENDLPHSSQ